MKKRNLIAEISEGFEALTRDYKQTKSSARAAKAVDDMLVFMKESSRRIQDAEAAAAIMREAKREQVTYPRPRRSGGRDCI